MVEQDIDEIPIVDPELQREKEERERKAREQELNNPSIDDLPPSGVKKADLSRTDLTKGPRTFINETARALEEREK